jgi:holo-[acyl-carrier protein] synthase
MVVGIGLDLVDIREFQGEVDEKREEWLRRVFSSREREYCQSQPDPYRHFAGTFAAKEASLKALGIGWTDHSDLKDVEVVRREGRPEILLGDSLMALPSVQKARTKFVSITHTKDHAAAVVVLES